jgi:PTS system nitrogen regulatory IIA component
MKLVDLIRPELVIPELVGRSKAQVLAEFSRHLAKTQPGLDAGTLNRILTEREQLATTAIGEDIAIPHGKIEGATRMIGCVGRSTPGVAFDSLDGKPTHLVLRPDRPGELGGSAPESAGPHQSSLQRRRFSGPRTPCSDGGRDLSHHR